ncbi:MAG TPA: lysophospholipid acyltransferase family protein [Steroidobacteraceae bacterium]|nr:lysophospholipid acyltransferase family protein [Steroidobacteraceae bacterium]
MSEIPAPFPARRPARPVRAFVQGAYALYACSVFALLALAALLVVLCLPGLDRRRRIVRTSARWMLRLAGMRLTVVGLERIPAGQCVIVANHASYLDGPVFMAVLPPRFGFVIKREMAAVPVAATLLKRIGSEFVERFNRSKGAADTRRVLRNATNGHSLVFFPEGTFSKSPGLLRFHAGAFLTAIRAGCPVIPAVIRGTRTALPPTGFLPWPAALTIEFLPPVTVGEATAEGAVQLRERARAAILAHLDEPDLAAA